MRRASPLLTIVMLAGFGSAAFAQGNPPAPDAPRAPIGAFEISNSDRDRICSVQLRSEAVGPGSKLEFDNRCAAAFPMTREVAAWSQRNDLLQFLDGRGNAIMSFSEVEGGLYESDQPGGIVFLQAAAAAPALDRPPQEIAGEWAVTRGERAVCTLALSAEPVGGNFALQVRPSCDAAVTRFGPIAWRIDRGELVLVSARSQTWRFEDNNGAWRRVPPGADAFSLIKR